MPEFPDIVVYIESLQRRIEGLPLENLRLKSMFLVRSVEPPISALIGPNGQRNSANGKTDRDLF
jgi:formamidopyrimidine-DNA glycosylase